MWYKFYCSHGPGHQSSDTDYFYYSYELSEEVKQDEWETWVNRNYWYNTLGEVELIISMPQKEKDRKWRECYAQIERMREILKAITEIEGVA